MFTNDEAKPKAQYKYAKTTLATGCLHKGITVYARSWELKRGRAFAQRGHIFDISHHEKVATVQTRMSSERIFSKEIPILID